MIQAPGELMMELSRGTHLVMKVDIGPYDRRDPDVGGTRPPPKVYRDVPGIHHEMADPTDPDNEEERFVLVNADLSDRAVSIGTISHRTSLLLDPVEASELSIEIENADGALNQLGQGSGRFALPHWWFRNNWHIGRLLRVQIGIRNRDKGWNYFPAYEGTIEKSQQTGRRIALTCLDPMKYLETVKVSGNPTYTGKTPPEIVEDLFNNHTGEPGDSNQTYARPIIDYESFDEGKGASPFNLDVTGTGSSILTGKTLAEAFASLALHGFGTVWIDGNRRLRYTVRETGVNAAQFPIDWDRNLIDSVCYLDIDKMRNSVTVTYGPNDLTSSNINEASIKRYYEQTAAFDLPYVNDSTLVDNWIARFLAEFAWPPLTYQATLDASGLMLEPGDWALVTDPSYGIDGLRFQTFPTEFDPASRTVRVTCHSTDPQLVEGGVFQVGISKFYSADRMQ